MRSLVLVVVLALAATGCQKDAPAAAPTQQASAVAVQPAAAVPALGQSQPEVVVPETCGGSCGGQCGNAACGGSCGKMAAGGDEAAKVALDPKVLADAQWTLMHVSGMRCGMCARRVKTALASVDGVLGVEVDVAKAEVRVATAKGADGRALATDPINALGYQVLAN